MDGIQEKNIKKAGERRGRKRKEERGDGMKRRVSILSLLKCKFSSSVPVSRSDSQVTH